MKDMQSQLETLLKDAAKCQCISDEATNSEKKMIFAKLAEHHLILAHEVQKAICSSSTDQQPQDSS